MTENTRDLRRFGYRELSLASRLLKAYAKRRWNSSSDGLNGGVSLEFNPNSGEVFLIDEDLQVAVLNDEGMLENWLTCPECGEEGMRSEVTFQAENACLHEIR